MPKAEKEQRRNAPLYRFTDGDETIVDATIKPIGNMYIHGCEGAVYPAWLQVDGTKKRVQIKQFFKESVDDRGEPFTQDPNKKAKESYESFMLLKHLGFKVLPFFGLATDNDGDSVLVMADLTECDTKEVIDEKAIARDRKSVQYIRGKEYTIDARKTYESLSNIRHIALEQIKTGALTWAHGISLGFGVSELIVRDPKTNIGEVYISDVGEVYRVSSEYRNAVNEEKLLQISNSEILEVFTKMLSVSHPEANASAIFEDYMDEFKDKKEFQDCAHMTIAGNLLGEEFMYSSYNDRIFAKVKFGIRSYMKPSSIVTFFLEEVERHFEEVSGYKLFDVSNDALNAFQNGEDFRYGIDIATLAVMDKRIQYLFAVREAVDKKRNIPGDMPSVSVGKYGLPKMEFLRKFGEDLGETVIIELRSLEHSSFKNISLGKDIRILAEVSWDEARNYLMSFYDLDQLPFIRREQIKGICVNGKRMKNFNPKLVKGYHEDRPLTYDDISLIYLYGNKIIYDNPVIRFDDKSDDLRKINKKLGRTR